MEARWSKYVSHIGIWINSVEGTEFWFAIASERWNDIVVPLKQMPSVYEVALHKSGYSNVNELPIIHDKIYYGAPEFPSKDNLLAYLRYLSLILCQLANLPPPSFIVPARFHDHDPFVLFYHILESFDG